MEHTTQEDRDALVPRNFRVDLNLWDRFDAVARMHERDRASHLRHLIRQAVLEHEGVA